MSRKKNWYHFANSYLSIAEGSCLLILNRGETTKWKGLISNYKKTEDQISTLILPTLFNLRHAIELRLKHFNLYFQDKINHTHDITQLFDVFEKYIKDNKKKILAHSRQDVLVDIFIDDLHNQIKNLELIVKKYYGLEILKRYIGSDFNIVDVDNTGFKYPENSISILIDYNVISSKVKIDTIREIHKDIMSLYKTLSIIDVVLYEI